MIPIKYIEFILIQLLYMCIFTIENIELDSQISLKQISIEYNNDKVIYKFCKLFISNEFKG